MTSRTNAGHPFIWCTLLNFGGQQGMLGDLSTVQNGLTAALTAKDTTINGVGITMEGIWTNYPEFEYTMQSVCLCLSVCTLKRMHLRSWCS
jgi:hypothetical protein